MGMCLDFNSIEDDDALEIGFGKRVFFSYGLSYPYSILDQSHNPNDLTLYQDSYSTGIDESININQLSTSFDCMPTSSPRTAEYSITLRLIRNQFRIIQLDRLPMDITSIDSAYCNMTVSNYHLTEWDVFQGIVPDNEWGNIDWNWQGTNVDNGAHEGRKITVPLDNANSGQATLALFGIQNNSTNDGVDSVLLGTKGVGGTCKSNIASYTPLTDLALKYMECKNNYIFFDSLIVPPNDVEIDPSSNMEYALQQLLKVLLSVKVNWTWTGSHWDCYGNWVNRQWQWDTVSFSDQTSKLNYNNYQLPIYSRMPYEEPSNIF